VSSEIFGPKNLYALWSFIGPGQYAQHNPTPDGSDDGLVLILAEIL
jgi:hypothetical protein